VGGDKAMDETKRNHYSGRFAYHGLDRVLHEKARLGIMTSLMTHADGLLFNDLKELCSLTDGNLSRHLQTLAEASLVEIWKSSSAGRSQTLCRLTETGCQRFASYVTALERVVRDAAAAEKGWDAEDGSMPSGWVAT